MFKPIRFYDGYGVWVCDQCRQVIAVGYLTTKEKANISSLKQGILTFKDWDLCTYDCLESFKRRYAKNPERLEKRRREGKAP